MSKASPIITALNAGEWSPLLQGRTDLAGYSAAAYRCENFIPTVQGPVMRRPGTGHVRQVKDSADRTWLVPFVKARDDALVIEFGDSYCRFYQNRAPVLSGVTKNITGATQADPVVITSTAHGLSNGQDVFVTGVSGMTEINGRWFIVANVTANTFELTTIHGDNVDGTGYAAYVSGGTVDVPYELASPYAASALTTSAGEFALDYVQTGDVLYITDRAGAISPRKLSRTAALSWGFSELQPEDGPFLDLNATATTMYVSAATGTITITASASVFTADDVGSLIRIDQEEVTATAPWKASTAYGVNTYVRSQGKEYFTSAGGTSGTDIPSHTAGRVSDGGVGWEYSSPGYGIARITAQSGTTATATVLVRFPQTVVGSGDASTLWRKGAWSDVEGYPTNVTFFRERLCFGKGQRLDMSVAANFESFAIDSFGETLPESAVSVTIQSGAANEIVGLAEGSDLIVITEGSEFVVNAPATSEPFGPNNVRVARQSGYGARPIQPVRVGSSVMFVQASGRKVRAMRYSFDVDGFIAPDQTIRSEHIAFPAVTSMARQEEPTQQMWFTRSDGVLLSLAYDEGQEVRAWARHPMTGVAECCAVIPSPDGTRDDVWTVVRRTINGATRRYVEYMRPEFRTGDDQEDATYADSGLTYDGSAATVLHGFDHLEGESVGILADGAAAPDATVTGGKITLASAASVVQAGLRYTSRYATLTTDAGAKDGTAQGKTKRITDCGFRVIDALGGSAGPDSANLDEIPGLNYRAPATLMGSPMALVTGDVFLTWPGGYETDGRVWYENDSMFPATVAAIMPQVVTQEAR